MGEGALLTDLYELTMGQAYLDAGLHETPATFSLYFRTLPDGWRYAVTAGLDDVLAYLEELAFSEDDLGFLRSSGLFSPEFLELLRGLRFTGDVRAMLEGTLAFPHEPLLEVTAPAVVAQLVESFVLNQVHLQTLIASKAARSVDAARGRRLVDFSLRRTHGVDAALKVARASWLAGFDATSNVLAGKRYGIPIAGTMAHSFIEAFPEELDAFRAFVHSFPGGTTLLVDTYDTAQGAGRAAAVAQETGGLNAVRIDSGDLAAEAAEVRSILDGAGLPEVEIFASGNLDELEIERLLAAGAPIDGFGVGSRMGTSADAPYLDMVYKLVAFGGRPVLKLSTGKASWPGEKQVWRVSAAGRFDHDVIGRADEPPPDGGVPLLEGAMVSGRRVAELSLTEARARCAEQRASLPEGPLEVGFSRALIELRESVAAALAGER